MRAAALARALGAGLAAGVALAALPAAAHQRSQSFSTWRVEGTHVRATWSVLALEATRLASPTGALADLGPLVARHLAARVALRRGGAECELEATRPLRARSGHLRLELDYRCPEQGELVAENEAFFEEAPSHVHFARVAVPGAPPRELLFRNDARVQTLLAAGGGDGGRGADLAGYVRLGVEHILGGLDHIAFLGALLLLGGGLRDLLVAITGFTVGHSVTLTSPRCALRSKSMVVRD